jgi:glycosyltransferase involved in cell wall biosynthesis
MRIAIVHYHLQTGGVTRVIQHACEALASAGHRVLVLTGEPNQQPLGQELDIELLAGLGYEERRAAQTADRLAAEMVSAALRRLGGPPDLWHVHNHCLGKNLALPGALLRLARAGHRLLLQPHDFAEDGRPDLFRRMRERLADGDLGRLSALLYPLAPQIHYAALNARDQAFLAAAGVPASQLHLLPNAVAVPARPEHALAANDIFASRRARHPSKLGQRLWLYPTRAIRRKNLGEFLLWAALGDAQDRFAATQAPQNPREQARYRDWVRLASELELPIAFEAGNRGEDFASLVRSSHALVSTSVGEGFGLAFLEPWLSGRPLAGRDLPEVTRDFRAEGIDLSGLYQRLMIPLSWIDGDRLRAAFADALAASVTSYGRPLPEDALDRAWSSAVADDRIDMGRLDEPAQEQVIRHLRVNPGVRTEMTPTSLAVAADAKTINDNNALVRERYGIAGYARRLDTLYHRVGAATPSARLHAANGEVLLQRFLAPERFTLLRT